LYRLVKLTIDGIKYIFNYYRFLLIKYANLFMTKEKQKTDT